MSAETIYAVEFRSVRFFRSKARKHADCWRCDSLIHAGEDAFRPLGNTRDRYRRICGPCVEQLVDQDAPHLLLKPVEDPTL